MSIIDQEFLAVFLDEARELLEKWESVCLKLEKNPSLDIINDLFRAAHNLKGSSKSVGLDDFGNFVHHAEDLITKLKNSELSATPEIISALLSTQKILADWSDQLRTDINHKAETTFIRETLTRLMTGEPESPEAALPTKDLGTLLVESGKVTQSQIEDAVRTQNRKLGEVLVDSGVVPPEVVKAALEQQKSVGHKTDETIRVSIRKLDSVIRLIGELSIQHAIVRNAKDTNTLSESQSLEAINLANKVIQDLRSEAMGLRMQPLENLFQRMERVCRDVARQLGKPLDVVLKGADVELDKTVIERMKDPLVHILRNAVDHGIENTDERKLSHKQAKAQITIEGIQTAANVTIRITDDGRGLNEKKILEKAIQKGLVDRSANPSRREIQQMIFLPGFSTAEKVTEVSGRGVGMDVVKKSVDDLGGSIAIESTEGVGTQFSIVLPSTLSILDAIVISLGHTLYAVPVQDVDEVVDLSLDLIETAGHRGRVLKLRGRVIPVEALSDYLGKNSLESPKQKGVALITRNQETTVAFEVDRVDGQQSIVVRQLEGNLGLVPGFAGATILANGEPAMIIHLSQIINSYLAAVK